MTTEMEEACIKAMRESYSLNLLRDVKAHDQTAYIAYLEQAFKVGFADGALFAGDCALRLMRDNDYANAMVKREKSGEAIQRRDGGNDMTTHGTPLKAGA